MLTCNLIDLTEADDSFLTEWRDLLARADADQQLFGPEWYTVWSSTWGRTGRWTGRLQAITVRDQDSVLQGLLSISSLKVGPMTVRACAGNSVPWRPIVAAAGMEDVVGQQVGRFLAGRSWPVMQLGPLLRSDPASLGLIETLRERGVFVQRRDARLQATLHMPDTWDEYRQEVIGAKAYRKIGYYERRTEKAGRMEIRHFRQPSEADAEALYEALDTIEAASWMATRSDAVARFTNPDLRHFWTRLTCEYLAPNDLTDSWVMYLDDRPVSFCFTLTSGTVRFVVANNYDQAVSDHRTGSTLYRYMLQEGFDRGIRRFEFGDGNINYKSLWGAAYGDSCDTYAVVPNRLLSPLAKATTRMMSLTRRPDAEAEEAQKSTETAPV
jgi:hypothetical protein